MHSANCKQTTYGNKIIPWLITFHTICLQTKFDSHCTFFLKLKLHKNYYYFIIQLLDRIFSFLQVIAYETYFPVNKITRSNANISANVFCVDTSKKSIATASTNQIGQTFCEPFISRSHTNGFFPWVQSFESYASVCV